MLTRKPGTSVKSGVKVSKRTLEAIDRLLKDKRCAAFFWTEEGKVAICTHKNKGHGRLHGKAPLHELSPKVHDSPECIELRFVHDGRFRLRRALVQGNDQLVKESYGLPRLLFKLMCRFVDKLSEGDLTYGDVFKTMAMPNVLALLEEGDLAAALKYAHGGPFFRKSSKKGGR